MADRETLMVWVKEALKSLGGKGKVRDVARLIWKDHEADLRASGDLFYSWQYDMRWAALKLRKLGELKGSDHSPRGVWELAK